MLKIKCEFCREDLHPLQLRQAIKSNGVMVYGVQCLNPECVEFNFVSEEFYLRLSQDFLKPYILPINNKLPSEMNVMFTSLERHGISWVIRCLSNYHKGMFGKPIEFVSGKNTEISPLKATRNRLPLPKGWNNVYGIPSQELLDKNYNGEKYDRVVMIQREYPAYLDSMLKYWEVQELPQYMIDKLSKKLSGEYKKMYECEDPDDRRFIRIKLEDLGNKASVYFNKLMDFLNFPSFGRIPVIPTPIPRDLRDWEEHSSVLEETEEVGSMLKKIGNIGKKIERKELKEILILGSQPFRGCHFGENLVKAFMNLGYEPKLLYAQLIRDNDDMTTNEYNRYLQRKERYPISKAIRYFPKRPQLIIVDQIGFSWKNDVNIPVFYKHNFFKRPPIVNHPTVAFFPHEAVITYFQTMFAPHWCEKVKELRVMPIAVDPDHFVIPEKKTVKGIACIGGRENMKRLGVRRELTAKALVETSRLQVKEFIDLGLNWIDDGDGDGGGVTDAHYRELLPQLEALWILIPFGQYASRRMLEAAICKVVCVMKIEDEYHEYILEQMGFVAGKHYIKIEKLEDMVELNENWDISKYQNMLQDAYDLVINNHTFECRAKELIKTYEEMMNE